MTSSQAASNPVAAMPSMHAGSAALMTFFLWRRVENTKRLLLIGYSLLMALALVYTAEHYVAAVIAGWVAAALAIIGWSALRCAGRWRINRRRRPAPPQSAGNARAAAGAQAIYVQPGRERSTGMSAHR
jgi:membrane-associated phospholipid phosphatase